MSLAVGVFTNAGKELLNRAQNGEVLTISKIVVGSGAATDEGDLTPLTALIVHEMDVPIASRNDDGAGTLLVEGNFTSDTAPHAFYLREVGVMVHIGTGPDTLYSVANVFTDPPDFIDPAAPTLQAFKLKLIIDRIPTGSLVVTIGASEAVSGENEGTGHGVYKETAGNILKFKSLVPGAGIALTDSTDGNSITIAASALAANVDLYVPLTYHSPPPGALLFDTIQHAHDYLLQFRIPAALQATIHVDAGTLTVSDRISFTHPDSRQIHVVGKTRIEKTVGSITFASSTLKRLAISDISGLANGLYGYVANSAPEYSGGCQLIGTPVSNNVGASIEKRDHITTDYTITDSDVGQKFKYYPTVIISTADPLAFIPVFDCPNGIGSIENLFVKGAWAAFSLTDGVVENCQAWGSTRGVNALGAVSLVGECVFTQCTFGITGLGTVTAFDQTYINACTQGITPSGSGFAIGVISATQTTTVVYISRNATGIDCGAGALFVGGGFWLAHNDLGALASVHSTLQVNGLTPFPNEVRGNTLDLQASGSSYIQYDRHTGPAPTCDPAAETVGNQNSFIHVLNTPL